MKIFAPSELIIREDGSAFHLHLRPEQLADKIILVGDPNRVQIISSYLETQECEVRNREFHVVTGTYKGKRLTVVSTGIGGDNCDIVINELDALANINFDTRTQNNTFRQLTFVRIGTSGGLQPFCPVGSFVVSEISIGLDGLVYFYKNSAAVRELEMETAFLEKVQWIKEANRPYIVASSPELVAQIAQHDMIRGVTISANGFYGPQGRELRIPLADSTINEQLRAFEYNGHCITNYEMESASIVGLSNLLGHKAMTVCCIIANRVAKNANCDYQPFVNKLIKTVLDRI